MISMNHHGLEVNVCHRIGKSHTSIKERVDNAVSQGRLEDVEQIRNGSVAAQSVSDDVEESSELAGVFARLQSSSKKSRKGQKSQCRDTPFLCFAT